MKTATVTKVGNSKKGTPTVWFDNQHDYSDAYYCSKKIDPPNLGDVIEPVTSSKTFEDGKEIWFLNSWKPAQNIGSSHVPSKEYDNAMAQASKKGWGIDSKDCAIILEVVLKAAFDKGMITRPEDMASWIERTYAYVEGLKSGKPIALDEPVPSFGPGVLEGPIDDGEPPIDF